ncbi:helix-turn-helix transcriptional regulator [Pusillimonas sp.]|uniref:helix-turn-helix transcriptional regulator n=1 Tax=Pusillimonas sp. TaxID=3040095 RepID=UPI0037C9B80C
MQTNLHKSGHPAPSTKPAHSLDTPEAFAASLPSTGYVRLPVVASICGVGKSTVWKWAASGRFPRPTKLSPRVSAWNVTVLRAWLADPNGWQAANAEVL